MKKKTVKEWFFPVNVSWLLTLTSTCSVSLRHVLLSDMRYKKIVHVETVLHGDYSLKNKYDNKIENDNKQNGN